MQIAHLNLHLSQHRIRISNTPLIQSSGMSCAITGGLNIRVLIGLADSPNLLYVSLRMAFYPRICVLTSAQYNTLRPDACVSSG